MQKTLIKLNLALLAVVKPGISLLKLSSTRMEFSWKLHGVVCAMIHQSQCKHCVNLSKNLPKIVGRCNCKYLGNYLRLWSALGDSWIYFHENCFSVDDELYTQKLWYLISTTDANFQLSLLVYVSVQLAKSMCCKFD